MEEHIEKNKDDLQPVEPLQPIAEEQVIASNADPRYEQLCKKAEEILVEIQKVIIGQDDLIEALIIGLLTKGHLLIEGVPGVAKTLTARLFAKCIDSGYSRIQFTPDLMPTDIVGTNIFNAKKSDFEFKPGPVFSNLILIDEINRAAAKTQSALFEVMQENQVSVDGVTYPMDDIYMVLATQNPLEQEGTYKLPEAQLDRFLFKINLGYPSVEDELLILKRFEKDFDQRLVSEVKPMITSSEIKTFRALIEEVKMEPSLLKYIAEIIDDTRNNGDLFLGASPRASLAILKGAKAKAALSGRDFVIPEDIQDILLPVLNHRVILSPEREMEGMTTKQVIDAIVKKTELPR